MHEHKVEGDSCCPDVHFVAIAVLGEKLWGEVVGRADGIEHSFFSPDKLTHSEIIEVDFVFSYLYGLRPDIPVNKFRVVEFFQAHDEFGKKI